MSRMHVAYIGNFEPEHSTENHVARALETVGHRVTRWLERPWTWLHILDHILDGQPDLILWTSTNDYAPPDTFHEQRMVMKKAHDVDVPVVGYHLDLWWGISRQHLVHEKPFFEVDLLCTADGGHPNQWSDAGIEHSWYPPAISRDEARLGHDNGRFASEIAFVGSWAGGYHRESVHRYQLIEHLKERWGDLVAFWPERGRSSIRGQDLCDLYASTRIVVGDSCMVPNLSYYWSDRVPETTGRGAFLLHPEVVGLAAQHPSLITWQAGDWGQLDELIQHYLDRDDERERIASACRFETLSRHTYEVRMLELFDELEARHML